MKYELDEQMKDKITFFICGEREKQRLGVDAALLVDDENIFILEHGIKRRFCLLQGRGVVSDGIPFLERNVFIDLDAVYPNILLFQQSGEVKRALRIGVIGERL